MSRPHPSPEQQEVLESEMARALLEWAADSHKLAEQVARIRAAERQQQDPQTPTP